MKHQHEAENDMRSWSMAQRSVSCGHGVERHAARIIAVAACLIGLAVTSSLTAAGDFNWEVWRALPVQHGGRHKPLETLGWETLRMIANRSGMVHPVSRERLEPMAAYLVMLFEWQGWDHDDRVQLERTVDWRPLYFHLHQADKWDEMPLFQVDYLDLRTAFGLEKGQKAISARQLAETKLKDRGGEREIPFTAWADKLLAVKQADGDLTELEQKGLDLANRFWSYQNHRMGRSLEMVPAGESDGPRWLSIAQLLLTQFDEISDPTGELRKLQKLFSLARRSYLSGDAATFNQTSSQFGSTLLQFGSRMPDYPHSSKMALEVSYNAWAPFRIGWVLMLASTIGMLIYWSTGSTKSYTASVAAYVGGLLAVLFGFGLRMSIAGRPPVTNMYESVVYVGAGASLLGLVFELIYRKRYIISAAAGVATLAFVLADCCPLILDPSLRPLEPVLRSNFWLITHVMTITLSYASLLLALGLGNITLGHYLFDSENREAIQSLSRFTYKAIQVGVLLLSAGVILGGVWADYSWGRFWGWDPKEVWALIALLGYLAVLHARFAGWVGHRGLAALSVACFSLVVMAWYGVNFVLGAGLHSYGFGGGGKAYVYAAVVLQLSFVAVVLWRSAQRDAENQEIPATTRKLPIVETSDAVAAS